MQRCPTCNSTYADNSLSFCLSDGTALVREMSDSYDPARTLVSPTPAPTSSPLPPTQVVSSAPTGPQSYQQPWTPQQQQWGQQSAEMLIGRQNHKRWFVVGIAGGLILIAGLIIILTRGTSSRDNSSATIQSPASPSPTAKTTPLSTPTPTNTPSPAQGLDIAGTWVGDYQQSPATLIITNRAGDSFSGTLNVLGYLVEVKITVNQNTRQMTLEEKRVVNKSSTADGDWQLDTSNGSISSDGKTMSGKGIDLTNKPFSWSFSKK